MKALRFSVLLLPLLSGCFLMARPHPDANTSTTRTSKAGLYQVTYVSEVLPVPKRELHKWVIDVRDADGHPIDGATIQVDGGMPDHGHGLPTRPTMREALGNGRYVVDGMKFNMGGYWVVDLAIAAPTGDDAVRFELNL